ncbi:hypothetical protein WA026_007336 [Henosepilachna vigintioctopunctata]|uniref:Amidase domain-containing protein n=1 Tax=Henosepilachna vigintioctopunctata TaxID=420089 RepID=A0AAW1UX05_9CUCU
MGYGSYISLWIRTPRRKVQVSKPENKLLMLSATKLAKLIRERKISSVDVIRAYIHRIKEVNPLINAVVENRFEKAIKEAEEVDDSLKRSNSTESLQANKPLLGVPLTVKASCKLSGMDFSVGLNIRKHIKADSDGHTVARIKSSGAIPLLVSNTPESGISWYCHNNLTGITCNPYDISRSSGGSSGGEGALVGSGASVIGIGSDIAGSIRLPAMWCGVFGHKPTPRIVSLEGHFPYPVGDNTLDYFTMGPITRYAEDLKLLLDIMTPPESVHNLKLNEKVNLSKLRIYCMPEFPKNFITPNVDDAIKHGVETAANFLENKCGSEIMKENNFKENLLYCYVYSVFLILQLGGISDPLKAENRNVMLELVKASVGKSEFTIGYLFYIIMQKLNISSFYNKFNGMNEDLKKNLMEALGDDGVLICPTYSRVASKNSHVLCHFLGLTYLMPFNTIGFPSTQVPCGRNRDGLPIGLQVVAAPKQDRLCLAVAEELEKCFGGWLPPGDGC